MAGFEDSANAVWEALATEPPKITNNVNYTLYLFIERDLEKLLKYADMLLVLF